MAANKGALNGIRVIELARVLAGPWAGQMLADMGADVIKIEQPGLGDDTRGWGPPFITGAHGEDLSAAYFHAANRGKRSIAIDLKDPDGQELVRRLVATADILVENFKVGGLAKYGLDYESLRQINPKLVYCSITGFGQTGPYARFAGYDFVAQGMSGFMSVTGKPEQEPMKAGIAIADLFAGVYAVTAIEAALIHALKSGEGQHVDIALLDCQVAVLSNLNMNYLASGQTPGRIGNTNPNIAPYEVFPVRDGHLILAVGNDGQFERFCALLGAPDMAIDPRFIHNAARLQNHKTLHAEISALTVRFSKAELLEACTQHAVPVGPINTIAEMFADPQVVARGMKIELSDADGNVIPGVRNPAVLSATPLNYDRPSPRLDADRQDILDELEILEQKGPGQ